MIGEDVLLYPESGAPFRRALRIAALYSRRITLLSSGFEFGHLELTRSTLNNSKWKESPILVRASDYARYKIEAADDIEALIAEGLIARPVVEDDSMTPHVDKILVSLLDASAPYVADLTVLKEELQAALIASPPNVFDFLVIVTKAPEASAPEHLELFHQAGWMWLAIYLALVAALSESRGDVATTCSPELMAVLPKVRHVFSSPIQTGVRGLIERRHTAHRRLLLRVFDRYLPSCENLPIHEILKLRQKRRAELEALHVALASLATEIDIHATEEEVELQIADLTARKVDPEVRDLEAALKESELEAIKKIGKSSESFIGAGVSVTLNLLLGAGVDASAASALLGGALVPLATEAVERARFAQGARGQFC